MQSSRKRAIWWLLALALVVRTVVVLHPASLRTDPDGYRLLAENLVAHREFAFDGVATAYRPPLYPLLLTCCVVLGPASRVAIGILHVMLGVATVALSYRLAERLHLGPWAVAAAALVALDPILLVQSSQVMTETLATFLVVAAFLLLIRTAEHGQTALCLLAGAVLGMIVLCRANLIVWVPLAAAWAAWPAGAWRKRIQRLALLALGATVVLAPWTVRNQIRLGRPVVATTHGGYTLLLANNPWYYEHLRRHGWRAVWDGARFNRQWRSRAVRRVPADEIRNQNQAYREAWATIRHDPETFLLACGVRIANFWAMLPHRLDRNESPFRAMARWAVAMWYAAQLVLAAVGLVHLAATPRSVRKSLWPWGFGLLLLFSLSAVHAVFWSNMRMRAPAMPIVAALAAFGACWLQARWAGDQTTRPAAQSR